jgi:hypothetical protein
MFRTAPAGVVLAAAPYIALNRCANVRETVSFSGRDLSVITGWSRKSRSTRAIACRLTIVARWICQNAAWSSSS